MSRFAPVTETSDPKLRALYSQALEMGWVGDREGVPNNFITAMGARPDLLETIIKFFNGVIGNLSLPPTVATMVTLTIAARSDCTYCTVAQTVGLEQMGVPEEVINSCAKDPELSNLPPAQRTIVEFGVKCAKKPGDVTDQDFEALRVQGLSDGEIMDIVMLAGLAAVFDIWADVSGIEVDERLRGANA